MFLEFGEEISEVSAVADSVWTLHNDTAEL
jgi:hypothetical protein